MNSNVDTSFLQQLSAVKRRVRMAVQELNDAMDALPAPDELRHYSAADDQIKRCDLHGSAVRLEVALDEATKWASKLKEQARAVADGESVLAEPFSVRCR